MENTTLVSDADDASRKELHKNEIDRLRLEIYMFILCSLLLWIICLTILYRHDLSLRRRRRQDDISIVLEEEQGQCQYMISFFTGMKYISPPSGVVRLHLIGSSFPGRFHEFTSDTPTTALFAPLSRQRFVITEDVPLGRIIAIVLQTEVEGDNPSWICHTVIVREIQNNEAWFFRIDHEIGFPPRTFYPSAEDELTSFKFSLHRRVRREVRQGQYIYFGFWFRTRSSVYRLSQRIVTTVTCHLILLALSLFILGVALPPTFPSESDATKSIDYEVKGISYGMGNGRINWVVHAVTIGTITSVVTSCVGYVIVALFRQRMKYEKEFEEMDYAIGTAMREYKLQKEKQRALMRKTKQLLKALESGRRKSEKRRSRSISKSVTTLFTRKSQANALESKSVHYPELVTIRQGDLFPSNKIEEFIILGGDDGRSASTEAGSIDDEEGPLVLLPGTTQPVTKNNARQNRENELRVNWLRNSQRERKAIVPVVYTDTDETLPNVHQEKGETDKSPSRSTITTVGIREFENSLVESLKHRLERAEHEGYDRPSTSSTPRSTLVFQTESILPNQKTKRSLSFQWKTAAEKRAAMRTMFVDNSFEHQRTKVSLSEIHLEASGKISTEQESWFGAPIKPNRKWYKPIIAWLFVILMIVLSVAGIIVTVLVGDVQLNGENEFFFLILIATLMTSFLMGTFIIETIKIWIIALISAAWDKKMHKRITDMMKRRESRASMLLQNARKSTFSNYGE